MRWCALILLLSACRGEPTDPPPQPPTQDRPSTAAPVAATSAAPAVPASRKTWATQELTWRYPDTPMGEMVVVVSIPETRDALPVLIAFHGLGEAQKGPERGARGWIDDYGLKRALGRLASPPITSDDTEDLAERTRLSQINQSLTRTPYRGMVIVTPYTPDIISPERSLGAAEPLGRWLVEELLPRVRRETPAIPEAAATGIDGVSLGGRVALLVGLAHPSAFGAVGALQPAIYANDLDALTQRGVAARNQNAKLSLRLLTSRNDFYLDTIQHLGKRWRVRGVDHQLDVIAGPHSYAFNRGPGVYEMLLFHDRALRGEPMF